MKHVPRAASRQRSRSPPEHQRAQKVSRKSAYSITEYPVSTFFQQILPYSSSGDYENVQITCDLQCHGAIPPSLSFFFFVHLIVGSSARYTGNGGKQRGRMCSEAWNPSVVVVVTWNAAFGRRAVPSTLLVVCTMPQACGQRDTQF